MGFSKASRKRMLEMMARLQPEGCVFRPSFITLTYGQEFPDGRGAKRDLFTLWKRIRRWHPGCSAIWRLELQKRGAPHLHLIYFGPYLPKGLLQEWWGEVICQDCPFTRIAAVRNWRRGIGYVSKYMAKVAEEEDRAEAAPPAEGGGGPGAPSGLDYAAYLTADDGLGRVWGALGRRFLPWGELTELTLGMGSWLYRWKDKAREEWVGVNDEQCAGASLFVDEPRPWARLAEDLSAQPGATWEVGAGAAGRSEGEEGVDGESSG